MKNAGSALNMMPSVISTQYVMPIIIFIIVVTCPGVED
jgi:hypothetical protein